MKSVAVRIGLFAAGLCSSGAWGQDAIDPALSLLYENEETISTATGFSKPLHLAPSVGSVITAEDIRAMGATTLAEALETVPGLHVSSSFNRLNNLFSIRGIHTGGNPQVLILVDGNPITYALTGSRPNALHLPVADISRIEVVRGPGSAIYGADAFAGVINVITKGPRELAGPEAGVRVGSFGSRDAWAQHGGSIGGWHAGVSVEWQKTDGDSDRVVDADLQTTLDQVFGTDASHAPGPLDTDYDVLNTRVSLERGNWSMSLWNWRQRDAGVGPGAAQALDPTGSTDQDLYLAELAYDNDRWAPGWEVGGSLTYYYLDDENSFRVLPAGAVAPIGADGNLNFEMPVGVVQFPDGVIGNPSATERESALDLVASYTALARHRVRIGTGYTYTEVDTRSTQNFGPGVIDGSQPVVDGTLTDTSDTPYIFMPDKSRRVWYVSLQDEWQMARDWELTAGIRYDSYSDFGETVNPRLALVWALDYNLTAKFLYGRAFRAPAFDELYYINNPSLLGNPDLDPETIDTWEAVVEYHPRYDIGTRLNVYKYFIEDAITFVPQPNSYDIVAQNAGKQVGHGLEFEASWDPVPEFSLNAGYAWQAAEDDTTGEPVADAPGHQVTLSADWAFAPGWYLHPQINHVADRQRAPADTREPVDDYTMVDLTLRAERLTDNLDLTLAARNLFDEDAREPSNGTIPGDYPLEGRSFYAELRYRLD